MNEEKFILFLPYKEEDWLSSNFSRESNDFHKQNQGKVIKISGFDMDGFAYKDVEGETIYFHYNRFVKVTNNVKLPDELFTM